MNNPNPKCYACYGTGYIELHNGKSRTPCHCTIDKAVMQGSTPPLGAIPPLGPDFVMGQYIDGFINEVASDKITEPIKSDQRKISYNRGFMPPNRPTEHD